ncbi:ABC transporter permease [Corynebacterium sp. HMSC062A03]|uniref:ABC transporter permease n=1 Tax=Corynebacterium sp. HMSC062A03 TaxID=1739285 RepID=UPI0008A2214B|nr:ABC transporter permease [Corynebacterium sp. HMSC062A03]OFL19837.1 ABC transporter permease [Corynebacterium sp. HMSC062A03]
MTSTLFRLHRTLWWRSVASNPSTLIMGLMMLVYGAIGLFSLAFMVYSDITAPGNGYQALTVGVAGGMLIYVLLALFMPAGENQLSPTTLGALPLSPREVLPGLLFSSLLTTRAIMSVVFSLVYAIIGSVFLILTGPGWAAVPFVVGMVLSCATTIIFGECLGQVASAIADSQKSRTQIAAMVVMGLLVFGMLQAQSVLESLPPLHTVGAISAWTPFGAGVGWALALADGHFLTALAQLLIAAASLGLLGWVWSRQISSLMRNPGAGGDVASEVTEKGVSKLELGAWSYSSPAAMEYTRALRYLTRDKRQTGMLYMMPLFGVLTLYQLWRGDDFTAYFMLCFSAIVLSSLLANDYGFDGPSNWVHMVAPVAPRTILHARHLAHVTIPFLGFVLLAVVVLVFSENFTLGLLCTAVAVGVFISTAAVGLGLTVLNPYPLSAPGQNRWNDKSGYSAGAFLTAFVGMLLVWVPALPGIVISVLAYERGGSLLFVAMIVSLLVPALVYAGVWRFAGNRAQERTPEIYATVNRYVS